VKINVYFSDQNKLFKQIFGDCENTGVDILIN